VVRRIGRRFRHRQSVGLTPNEGRQATARAGDSPLGVPFITGPTRHVVEWSLLRARREPQRLNFLFIPVFGVGSAVVNMILQGSGSLARPSQRRVAVDGLLARRSVSTRSVMKGRPAGNPDCRVRAGVRPGTHRSVSAVRACRRSRHARCCTRGGHGLLSAIALALIGCFLTVVGATLAPIVGMWFPRYSAIRIGNSDGVRPPRLLAGALHVASVWLPRRGAGRARGSTGTGAAGTLRDRVRSRIHPRDGR